MRRFAIISSLLLLSSCTNAAGPQPVNQAAPPSTAAPSAGGTGPHTAPDSQAARSDAPTQPRDAEVAEAKAAYDKNPNDAAAKNKLAEATFENAQYYMYNSPLGPKDKYPKALGLYREVVKLDPTNRAAQESIDMIENIYRSMGRPIPNV